MGEGVLPTVQVLSEVAKTRAERGEMCHETPRNKDAAVQGHDKGTEGTGVVQLTKSAGVVDVDDDFSWC